MKDYTKRGVAKRKSAEHAMLQESASLLTKAASDAEEAKLQAITEDQERSLQLRTANVKAKRGLVGANKVFTEAVNNCLHYVLAEAVFKGIPADDIEKAPYRNVMMAELTEFFASSACNTNTDSHFVKAATEEISIAISEGFDASGSNNDHFNEYSTTVVRELVEHGDCALYDLIESYAPEIEQRTLSAILSSRKHAEQLTEQLEIRQASLVESGTADDKHLTTLALNKIHAKVQPTLFESVFVFVKARHPEESSEIVMQEAACFTSMLEGANLMGVLDDIDKRALVRRLASGK